MRFSSVGWLFLLVLLSSLWPGRAAAQCRLLFDYTQWEEVARDDFNGTQIDTTRWDNHAPYGGKYFGWGSEWYDTHDPTLRTVSGGAVHLKATRWLDAQGAPRNDFRDPEKPDRKVLYRSGMLLGRHGGPFHQPGYGAWEARIKLPLNAAAWPAFWLWSTPTEIDILDGVNYDNRGAHPGFLTNVINPSASCERRFRLWSEQPVATLLTEGYHLYTMVWTPEQVTFFLDGRELRTVPQAVLPTNGRSYLDLMVTMQAQPWSTELTEFVLDVDYIRVLKPRCQPGPAATDCQRDYHAATGTYKTASEYINHDLSATPRPDSSVHVQAAAGSIVANPHNANEVFFLGTDSHLYVATRNGSSWHIEPLPTGSGWQVLSNVTYHTGLHGLVYRGRDRRVQAYYQLPGAVGWQHAWVTPRAAPRVSAQPGAIVQGQTDQSIVYLGKDHRLHRYVLAISTAPASQEVPDALSTLRSRDQAAAIAGDLLLGLDNQTIFYRGADGRLQYYQLAAATYQHGWVGDSTSHYLVLAQPQSVVRLGSALYFIGQADHRLHCFAYGAATGAFNHTLLPVPPDSAGHAGAALAQGSLAASPTGNRLTYLGADGRIQGYQLDEAAATWRHYWLDDYWNTGEYQPLRPSYTASLAMASEAVVYYCGRDQHLRCFSYEPCENAETPATCGVK